MNMYFFSESASFSGWWDI